MGQAASGRIGPYQLVQELGRGSFGVVYLARRPDLGGQEVALKVVPPFAGDAVGAERFRREVELARRLQHPGIVRVLDRGEAQGWSYYAMELCRGPSLRERLRWGGALPPGEALELVASLADSLAWAHARGVIHRDLKPDNVILGERPGEPPRITDFGLARDTWATSLTRTGEVLGTPYYMAPEQLTGQRDLDARADLYALGVILYQLLTGKLPFGTPSFARLVERVVDGGPPPPPSSHRPELPPALDALCLRLLARDPRERVSDAATLSAELRRLLAQAGGAPREPRPAPAAAPAAPRPGRATLPLAVGAVALVGVGLGVGVLLARGPGPEEVARAAPSPPAESGSPDPAPSLPALPEPVAPSPAAPRAPSPVPLTASPPLPSPAPAAPALPSRPRHFPPGARELQGPRRALVEGILRPQGGPPPLQAPALIEALGLVPRHVFVADELRGAAYRDDPLPFLNGRSVAKPSLIAQMIEVLQLRPGDRVLELGTCSGYQTALLAHLTEQVYSVEPDAALSARAAGVLLEQGYAGVQLRHGDPLEGWPEAAPFQAVLITGAVPEVPRAAFAQLAIGGRMVLPLAPPGEPQRLLILTRTSDYEASQTVVGGISFHFLPGWTH